MLRINYSDTDLPLEWKKNSSINQERKIYCLLLTRWWLLRFWKKKINALLQSGPRYLLIARARAFFFFSRFVPRPRSRFFLLFITFSFVHDSQIHSDKRKRISSPRDTEKMRKKRNKWRGFGYSWFERNTTKECVSHTKFICLILLFYFFVARNSQKTLTRNLSTKYSWCCTMCHPYRNTLSF